MAITKSAVPAAITCEVPNPNTSTGITRKPPPIPKRPVIEPIKREMPISTGQLMRLWIVVSGEPSMLSPAKMMTSEKPMAIKSSESLWTMEEKPIFVVNPIAQMTTASL